MSKIFLSHSSRDNFEAVALRDWLAREGWDEVFLDLDPDRGIAAGERWERKLHEAANRCEAVIFLVSANWLASSWCLREYTVARMLNKKLFAVVIDPGKSIADLPEYKGTWQAVDVTGGQDGLVLKTQLPGSHDEKHVVYSQDGLRRLKRGLEEAGLDPKFFAWPPEGERDRAPYRGLKPMEAVDAGIFFGRDAPIVEAIDRLRGLRSAASPRILVILGASGAGKSSFLRAGLLPRLGRDDRNFVVLPVIRPERASLTGENGLLPALKAALPGRTRAELRKAIEAGDTGVRPLLRELAEQAGVDDGARSPTIVLAIDQAEELFRSGDAAEGVALLDLIRDLTCEDDPAVIVLFAIRSDSYDALQRAKPLEGLPQGTLPLLPMPRGAYKEVIEGPARRFTEANENLTIEPRLTARLLEDVAEDGGSDALPLLAFTLEQLFEDYGRSGVLRLQDYWDFGGLKGAIDAAVARAFQRADVDPRIPREREQREARLRRGFVPWLAGIDPDSKTPRRNIARRSAIPEDALPLINLLVDERLLSTDTVVDKDVAAGAETRVVTIEPAHEALLRQWGLLNDWLAEDFGLLATLEGVRRAARDWDANSRADAWLAHQGQRLAETQALDARLDIAAMLDAQDRAYLAACHARDDAARAEADARRRERAEEDARRLADAQALAASRRRAAIVLASVLALAIITTVFAVYGFVSAREALSNFNSARSIALDLLRPVAPTADAPERLDVLNRVDEALSTLASRNAYDNQLALSRLQVWEDQARLQISRNNLAAAMPIVQKEVTYTRDLMQHSPGDVATIGLAAESLIALGDLQSRADPREAFTRYKEALSLLRGKEQLMSGSDKMALALERVGTSALTLGDLSEAGRDLTMAADLRKRTLEASPHDAFLREDYTHALSNLASLQILQGDFPKAVEVSLVALKVRRALVEDQPGDAARTRDLAKLLCRLTMLGKASDPRPPDIDSWIAEGARHAADLMILDPRNPQNAPLVDAFRALAARANPDGPACSPSG